MYSVGVSNMFALLEDESSSKSQKPARQSAPKKQDTKPKEQKKETSASKAQKPKGKEQGSRNTNSRTGGARTEGARNAGGRARTANGASGRPRQQNRFSGPRTTSDLAERTGKPNRRGERGERKERSRRAPREGKKDGERALFTGAGQRQFDRKSGTGRPRGEKKAGGGRGNWGKQTTSELKAESDLKEKKEGDESETKKPAESEGQVSEVAEEDKPTMSYDEYLESLKTEKVDVSLPAARKAGEGEDNSKWAKYNTKLVKKTEDKKETPQAKKTRPANKKPNKSGKVPVDQVFAVANQKAKRKNNKNSKGESTQKNNTEKKRDAEFSLEPESFPSLGSN